MSEKQPKYLVIQGSSRTDFQDKLTMFSEDGYRVHSYTYVENALGEGEEMWTAILYLDIGNYEGVTNIADIPTAEAQRYLDAGWEIASASISTKFVRMIKRGTPETPQ